MEPCHKRCHGCQAVELHNPHYPQGIGHVVVYIGHAKAIHASGQADKGSVREVPLAKLWQRRDLVTVRRIFNN